MLSADYTQQAANLSLSLLQAVCLLYTEPDSTADYRAVTSQRNR